MLTTSDDASSATASSPTAHDQQPSDDQQQQCPSVLLFSLQFFLSSVDLRLPQTTTALSNNSSSKWQREGTSASFLVGFQLLQYEIVLFDAVAAASGEEGDGVDAITGAHSNEAKTGSNGGSGRRIVLKHQHGKSCLFEADADHLALDLQRECDAPLALLVMQQDHGKARLVAFASVPVDIHVSLLNSPPSSSSGPRGASMNQEMRFRVREWASSSGKWELRDHCNRMVGVATGAVTLSCLGRTLAPHIVSAIGLQVDKVLSPPVQDDRDLTTSHRSKVSVRDSSSSLSSNESSHVDDGKSDSRARPRSIVTFERNQSACAEAGIAHSSNGDEALGSKPVAAQKTDIAVQCDQESIAGCEEDDAAERSHVSPRAAPRGNCQVYPAIYIESWVEKHARSSEKHLHPSSVKTRSSRLHHPVRHDSPRAGQRNNPSHHHRHTEQDSSLFARELPPALFFQKPKQQQPKKKR